MTSSKWKRDATLYEQGLSRPQILYRNIKETAEHQKSKSLQTKSHNRSDDSTQNERLHGVQKRKCTRSLPRTDLTQCIVCKSKKADRRNRRVPEKLTQCVTFEAAAVLQNTARIRGDKKVLLEVEGNDLIAKEVCYHRLSYSSSTLIKRLFTDSPMIWLEKKMRERPTKRVRLHLNDSLCT